MNKQTVIEQTEKYYLPVFGRYQMVMDHGQGCKVWDNEGKEYIDAFAGIAVMFAEISIVELAKYTWARPRFRYLLQLGSYDRFTPWYRPLGFNFDEGNNVKSFPSGHTAGGAVSYLAMLLPFCTEKLKDKTLLCFAVPFVYTSMLAYTRMVMGAHFLTDVTVGGMITFTLIIIATAILDKKHYALKEH